MSHPHQTPDRPARRAWLERCFGGVLLVGLSWSPPARADWTDDVGAIAKLATQGNFLGAEKVATQSLAKGPGGLLFAGTGTLIIHLWRARLRLLGGDTVGAITDADKVIQADSTMLPPDAGYAVRGLAKALSRDVAGSEADFALAIQAAGSGYMSRARTFGTKGERAVARMLLNDFGGAQQDLLEATSMDVDSVLLADYLQAKTRSWMHLRNAIAPLESGDFAQASIAARAAVDEMHKVGTDKAGSDFLTPQLLLMQIEMWQAEREATLTAPTP